MIMKTKPSIAAKIGIAAATIATGILLSTAVFAQSDFPQSGGTTLGGQSAFDPTPGTGSTPTPTAPSGGSNQITVPPGPSSSSPGSGYCAGASSTILASSSKVGDVLKFFTCFIESSIIPLLFMLALAVFVWGMVKFIMASQSAEKEDGKQFMLWGVIALAVMFSVWGLVNILQTTFQVRNAVPQLTVPTGS